MSATIPPSIPDLDDGQFLPFGNDDDFELGVRTSDGKLVIKTDTAGSDLVISSSLDITIPGDLTVSGTTTDVDDVLTTDVTVEDGGGNNKVVLDGDATTAFLRVYDDVEFRLGDDDDRVILWDSGQSRAELQGGDLIYTGLTGNPSMATHDHSEGGTTTIPNSGLSNSTVGVTAGTGVATNGDGSIALGESETYSLDESVIKDGGGKEIDIQEFAAGDGTNGQVIQSDGSAASWVSLAAADISDVSADSVVDAHHAKYADSDARTAAQADDTKIFIGAAPDFSWRYDSSDDESVWRDESNNDDVMGVDKAGNLALQGTLTESTTV